MQRGESIENPVTGERLVLRTTTADSGGELLAFDLFVRADGFLVGEHVHLGQEERLELVSGRMYLRVGREERALGPGDTALVPAGVRHYWRNEGDQEFHAVIELRPALRAELLFELGCRLAREGKLNRRGIPKNPLLAAVIAAEFEREISAPSSSCTDVTSTRRASTASNSRANTATATCTPATSRC